MEQSAASNDAVARLTSTLQTIGTEKLAQLENVLIRANVNQLVLCLYNKNAWQCQQCGLRQLPRGVTVESHMDQHFRANKTRAERHRKAQSRSWYQTMTIWVAPLLSCTFSLVPLAKTPPPPPQLQLHEIPAEGHYLIASECDVPRRCAGCNDVLQYAYDYDDDNWLYVGVVRSRRYPGALCHVACRCEEDIKRPPPGQPRQKHYIERTEYPMNTKRVKY